MPQIQYFLTVAGLLLGVAGWLVTYWLAKRRDRDVVRRGDEKKHLDEQLACLYGPIYALLLENDRVRRMVQEQFGRTTIFEGGQKLPDDEERIWVHYLEAYFLPNNRRIVDIILSNIHLLHGYRVPPSFKAFIDYATGFEMLHKQYKDLDRAYGFHYATNFPREFTKEIIDTVSSMKKRQWELVGQELPEPHGDV